jgi:phosphatidylglycerophosphate synthase
MVKTNRHWRIKKISDLELSPRAKFVMFTLLVGIALIIILSSFNNTLLPASAQYLVVLAVIVLYAIIARVLQKHRDKEQA